MQIAADDERHFGGRPVLPHHLPLAGKRRRIERVELLLRVREALVQMIGLLPIWPAPWQRFRERPLVGVAPLAVVSSVFVHMYVDHTNVPWLPRVHWTPRAAGEPISRRLHDMGGPTVGARLAPGRASATAREPGAAAIACVLITVLAYYYIDHFPGFPISSWTVLYPATPRLTNR